MNAEKSVNDDPPVLGSTRRDRMLAGARAFAGAAPYIGPIISEIVGQLIPEQRIERVEAYIRKLDERLREMDRRFLDNQLKKPEKIDLFEDGALQAARALIGERIDRIANIVSRGLSGEEKEVAESKKMLKVFSELDDDEVVRLASFLLKNNTAEFRARHTAVLEPVHATMASLTEEKDRETLQDAAEQHLVRLGLLRPYFRTPMRDESPEFDGRTGMMRVIGHEVTSLGLLLMRYAGLADEEDM